MWNKTEQDFSEPVNVPPLPKDSPIGGSKPNLEQAVIGASISIKGDLTGEEDLLIQGNVEGTIRLHQHNVTVGKNGRIKADIYAKGIKIEGEVEGNLSSEDKIEIRKTGHVRGNVRAPKVHMEEGCRFKGSVDMDVNVSNRESQKTQASPAPTNKPATEKGQDKANQVKERPVS